MPASLLDLMQFILENKTDKCFIDYDEPHIATKVYKHLQDNSCWITQDSSNRITGMIIATINHIDKIIFVDENLSMCAANLRAFAKRAKKEFPNYILEFYKHGKYHLDSDHKIYDKLCT